MRLLKTLIGLMVVLLLAFFLNMNYGAVVEIWLYPGNTLPEVHLATALVASLGIGIVIGFLIGLLQILGQQRKIMGQNTQLKKLRTELNNLRHSGLDEEDVFNPAPPEPEPGENLPMVVKTEEEEKEI